jgi:hypothetical protein
MFSAVAFSPAAARPEPQIKNTLYQRIKNSAPGSFVRHNKILSGVAATGASIVTAGAANESPAFASFAQHGIIPALGAGVAVLGGAAIQDAIVNDLPTDAGFATAKIGLGTVGVLGGAQTVGMAYNIPVLRDALTGTLERIADNGMAVLGGGALVGSAYAARFAANRFAAATAEHGAHRGANALVGVTASAAAGAGTLGGLELIGRQYHIPVMDRLLTNTVQYLSHGGIGAVAGGGFLLAGSGVLGAEAIANLRGDGPALVSVTEGMGAVTAGLGGLELMGHGLGIKPLEGLLTQHAPALGSAALAGMGAALTRDSVADMKENGLGVGNSLAATLGSTAAVGGTGLLADTLGWQGAATFAGHGSEVVAGAGLALATAALARGAAQRLRQGDVLAATGYAAGAAVTGSGSLGLVGSGLGIDAVSKLGEKVFTHTIEPLWDHVISPAATFLYQHPVAGAVVLVAGVGAYAYYRHRMGGEHHH